jgi:hypothetical protein
MTMLETDGPYGGASCASDNHTHHDGLSDSIYMQTKMQSDFYTQLRQQNIFINQPDEFFFQGGQKSGMGYDENQYSLARWEDLSVSRAGMFDDTYERTPTQGWMFVPLVDYHGGGEDAAFEPLEENLDAYEWALAQYLGYGVAACYRGTRLFDSDKTKAVVTKWTTFYTDHREILISDIVHVLRPDMQGIDAILHVNPNLEEVGLAMVFNPLDVPVTETVRLPMYYTGLASEAVALLTDSNGNVQVLPLGRDFEVHVEIDMPPRSIEYFVVKDGSSA